MTTTTSTSDAELRSYIDKAQSVLSRSVTVEEIGDLTGFWKAGASVEDALSQMSKAEWELNDCAGCGDRPAERDEEGEFIYPRYYAGKTIGVCGWCEKDGVPL